MTITNLILLHRIASGITIAFWATGALTILFSGIWFGKDLLLHILIGVILLCIAVSLYFRTKAFHHFLQAKWQPIPYTPDAAYSLRRLITWDLVINSFSLLLSLMIATGALYRVCVERLPVFG